MDAIKIYEKIIEATKGMDTGEALIALQFATRKVETEHYNSQKVVNSLYSGTALGASAQYNPHDEAVAIVRRAVREELDATQATQEAA